MLGLPGAWVECYDDMNERVDATKKLHSREYSLRTRNSPGGHGRTATRALLGTVRSYLASIVTRFVAYMWLLSKMLLKARLVRPSVST